MHKIIALCMLLTACAAESLYVDDDSDAPARWDASLVAVRYAACPEETEEAIEFWRSQGASYLEGELVADTQLSPSLYTQPFGAVEIVVDGTDKYGHGVTSSQAYTSTGDLARARIWMTSCFSKLIAHELGHALGLGHTDENRIMNAHVSAATPWEASEPERWWVSAW